MSATESTDAALANRFAAQRSRLRGIAFRVLGSHHDAEDAVQETWLRLQRAPVDEIERLEAWLTTVVSRVCIDRLRSGAARHEDPWADLPDEPVPTTPETALLESDDLGAALLVVLDRLTPAERVAFVLHDVFAVGFDEVARIVGRQPAAARQLASRARRRVRAVDVEAERSRRHDAVAAFLKASREGDFDTLLRLLDPEVELRADPAAIAAALPYAERGAPLLTARARGADAVATVFRGRARETGPAVIEGVLGAAYAPAGTPYAVYGFTIAHGRITRIEVVADHLDDLDVVLD